MLIIKIFSILDTVDFVGVRRFLFLRGIIGLFGLAFIIDNSLQHAHADLSFVNEVDVVSLLTFFDYVILRQEEH